MTTQSVEKITAKNVAIARAAYEAYVTKDRAALDSLLAEDFHFTSPLDNRLDRETSSAVAGRTARSLRRSTSSISSPMPIACSSRMKDGTRTAVDFETRRFSRSGTSTSSMSRCTSAGHYLTTRRGVDSWTKPGPSSRIRQRPRLEMRATARNAGASSSKFDRDEIRVFPESIHFANVASSLQASYPFRSAAPEAW